MQNIHYDRKENSRLWKLCITCKKVLAMAMHDAMTKAIKSDLPSDTFPKLVRHTIYEVLLI